MMNEELKPCPFCGRDVRWESGAIVCHFCRVSMSMPGLDHEYVNERWNVRYEPTCTMEKVLLYDEECVEGIECDECGWSEIHDHSEPIPYTHCPNCKAKVEA